MTAHDHKVKAILYKAKYRGSKEVDHIIMTFVQQQLKVMDVQDYDALVTFLDQDDIAVFACIQDDQPSSIEAAFVKYLIDIQWFKSKVS